jgi:hypothetical protein
MPCAELKSVPVFFSDCMAARTACTMATHETSEKTGITVRNQYRWWGKVHTDNLGSHFFRFFACERRVNPPEITLTRTWNKKLKKTQYWMDCGIPTGLGANAATVDSSCSLLFTPSMKHTSAPASAASLRRVIASSIPNTCAESVLAMMIWTISLNWEKNRTTNDLQSLIHRVSSLGR